MKSKILIVLMVILSGLSLVFGEEAKLSIPQKGWRVNNFKKIDCGANLTFEKTPDGNQGIRSSFFGKNGVNISLKPDIVSKQAKNWPETFNGLKGYFWNDGKQNWLTLGFKQKDTKGKFSNFVKMDHKGWKRLTIRKLTNFQDKSKKIQFKPNECNGFVFNLYPLGREKAVVGFGPLAWAPAGAEQVKLPVGAEAKIKKSGVPPKIDGVLDDISWKEAIEFPLGHKVGRNVKADGVPQNKSWTKATFDDTNLYVAGKFNFPKGAKLKAEIKDFDAGIWKDEDVEFYIFPDIDQRQYYHLAVNPIGTRTDLAKIYDQVDDRIRMFYMDWNGNWDAKTKINDNSWTVEAVIPWKTLNISKPPEILQFQAQRIDRTGKEMEVSIWCPARIRGKDTFGALVLDDSIDNPLTIDELTVYRTGKNCLMVSGKISASHPLGKVDLKAWLSNPFSPAKTFVKTIESQDRQTNFSWELNVGQCVNGFHVLVIKATPESPELSSNCIDFHFNQVLPPEIGFSDVFLNPVPKELTWGAGSFAPDADTVITLAPTASPRTEKTTRYLVEKLYGHFGIKPPIKRDSNGRIKLSIDKEKVKEETGTDWREAYLLDITPQSIEITGAGEAGLYYGVVTLGQMLNSTKQPNTPLKAVNVKDWPTFKKRIAQVAQQFHNKKSINGSNGYRIERLKEWIRNRVAGSKFNTMPFCWCDQINYPSRPELHHPNNFSPKEIKDLFSFAREHFIDVFPAIKMGGHSTGWTSHYPELIEKKFGKAQMDVSNPKVYELMKDIINDLLKMSGPETKYFHTTNDEWWHNPQYQTMEYFVHNGKNRQELYRDFLLAQYKMLKEKGVRMIMHNDMLHPQHNGRPPWNLKKVAEQLPRDIILSTWGPSNKRFLDMGFKEVWTTDNGFVADYRKPCKGTTGFGSLRYLIVDSMFNSSNMDRWLHYCSHTMLQAANYAWNGETKASLPMPEWTMQYMPNLMGTYSKQANPMAGEKLEPVEIKSNDKPKKIDLNEEDVIGDIPMKLNSIEITPEKPLKIDFDSPKSISSIYILDCVMVKDKATIKKLQTRYKKQRSGRPYGLKIGKYVLHYADGSKVSHDILLGRNIYLFKNTSPALRFIKEGRCLYPLTRDQSEALVQIEWVNPHPEKQVKSFETVCDNLDATICFCGLTVRDTKGKK